MAFYINPYREWNVKLERQLVRGKLFLLRLKMVGRMGKRKKKKDFFPP